MKEDSDSMERKQVMSLEEAQTLFLAGNNVDMVETKEPDEFPAHEEENNESNLLAEQTKSKDFVELSDFAVNQPQAQESTISPCPQEDHSSVNGNEATLDAPERNGFGPNSRETTTMEEKLVSADNNQEGINHDLSSHLESTETEEEKKLLLFEKRESGNEESLDGSVVSETDSGDPVLTIERLKTNLKAERKAFGALYTELEEERSASAIAANQTMAMINRLQEEKAAMQMEALQYQRMMEEQSEYDQEALQLLNELMIKREREKQDLEKELEVNAEDLDELSIDLNREAKDEDGSSSIENQEGGSNNTSSDGVINLQEIALDYVKQISALDDPLAEFEEERLSILDQLKALEEKLQNLDANEDMHSEEQSSKYNARGFDESFEMSTPEENGILNELSKIGDYPERKTVSSMAKNLLPLLDAAENETEEGFVFNENVESEFVGMENSLAPKFDLDGKKLAIEEEVDHVYERLQALEVDREFLNHCMSSMQMGDKGTSLLQEILKHLRDLRGVELRVGNTSEEPLE
ncbi:hypothetical protein OIU78_026482 [Salix suchowensis]|nr:hypothetical protein OIU78_026482 [Salix suchowensis]